MKKSGEPPAKWTESKGYAEDTSTSKTVPWWQAEGGLMGSRVCTYESEWNGEEAKKLYVTIGCGESLETRGEELWARPSPQKRGAPEKNTPEMRSRCLSTNFLGANPRLRLGLITLGERRDRVNCWQRNIFTCEGRGTLSGLLRGRSFWGVVWRRSLVRWTCDGGCIPVSAMC